MVEYALQRGINQTDRLPAVLLELEQTLLSSLICIDHGFDPSRPGYTAAGFVAESGNIITAAHNLNHGHATIINPQSLERQTYDFTAQEPDTAISTESLEGVNSHLKTGLPQPGDFHLAFWLRHVGNGQFMPCSMWGENAGLVQQDGKTYWGFKREGEQPRYGDSGALVLTVGRQYQIIEPVAVGIFRSALDENRLCVFSPLETTA